MHNAAKFAQYITEESEGYTLHIALNDVQCASVAVDGISMYIAKNAKDGDGDLAVSWDVEGLQNTGGGDMGMLLMRGDEDEVGAVMGAFYWDNAFTEELRNILLRCGFSKQAAEDVCTSEWGMQDEGRASYDAYELAAEVRAAFA